MLKYYIVSDHILNSLSWHSHNPSNIKSVPSMSANGQQIYWCEGLGLGEQESRVHTESASPFFLSYYMT